MIGIEIKPGTGFSQKGQPHLQWWAHVFIVSFVARQLLYLLDG